MRDGIHFELKLLIVSTRNGRTQRLLMAYDNFRSDHSNHDHHEYSFFRHPVLLIWFDVRNCVHFELKLVTLATRNGWTQRLSMAYYNFRSDCSNPDHYIMNTIFSTSCIFNLIWFAWWYSLWVEAVDSLYQKWMNPEVVNGLW